MKLSRIQIFAAGVISAMAGTALAQYVPHPFVDISPGSYFSDAVGKWWRRGVIKGYDNGHFGPDDPVTRGQMAVILDRFESSTIDSLRQEIMQINRQLGRNTSVSTPTTSLFSSSPTAEDPELSPPSLPPNDRDAFCIQKKSDLDSLFDTYRSCQVDSDCALFMRPCGPYVTCGKPVTKNVLPTLERSVTVFEDVCTDAFPVACATCVKVRQRCEQSQCVTVTEEADLVQKCTAYLREGDTETYCATCGNDICESFERCISSNCQNGACTQDCGGLYCPGDCDSPYGESP